MEQMAKLLMIFGLVLFLGGGLLYLGGRFFPLGHLPGDIFIRGEHGIFFFPIVSCILISIVLSVIFNVFFR